MQPFITLCYVCNATPGRKVKQCGGATVKVLAEWRVMRNVCGVCIFFSFWNEISWWLLEEAIPFPLNGCNTMELAAFDQINLLPNGPLRILSFFSPVHVRVHAVPFARGGGRHSTKLPPARCSALPASVCVRAHLRACSHVCRTRAPSQECGYN